MKNKLFVRGAVIVVALMLLVSTVAFADAVAPTFDAENCAIVFDGGYTSTEDQVTIMAFAVEKGTDASEVAALADGTGVIAINQVAGSVGFTTVKINPDLFEEVVTEDKDIAVLVGGSNGEVKPFVLSTDAEVEEPTTYTVAYELNGGTVETANATTFTDETVAEFLAALVAPTKADLVEETETATSTTTYTFVGWYLDETFETAATAESIVAGASTTVTLYAKWDSNTTTVDKPVEEEKVTVTLNGNGGKFGDATTLAIEVAADATFADVLEATTYAEPVKTKTDVKGDKLDWVFVGWYTDVACETAVDLATTVSATNLYAKFVQVYVIGDVNLDGKVNATDYNQIKKYCKSTTDPKLNENYPDIGSLKPEHAYIVKKSDGSEVQYLLGDITGDGKVNATDYNQIKKYCKSTTDPKLNENYPNISTAVIIR